MLIMYGASTQHMLFTVNRATIDYTPVIIDLVSPSLATAGGGVVSTTLRF